MMSGHPERLLVTGGSGFIGTNIVSHFGGRGFNILNLDMAPPRNISHAEVWQQVDLLDDSSLKAAVRSFQPDFIIHAAARTDLDGASPDEYEANVCGVRNVIDAILGVDAIRHVIFLSSRLVCRIGYAPTSDTDYSPTTAYGASKVMGERLVRDADLDVPWTILRPTSIWGPWFDVPYRTFFDQIARGRLVRIGDTKIFKSFGFVGNTMHELERLLYAPSDLVAGRTFYLADYVPLDVWDWAACIRRTLGAPPIRTAPKGAIRAAARAGDVLQFAGWKNVPLTSFRLDNLVTPMVHDLSPLQAIVGPLPYSMEAGVAATVEWLRLHSRTYGGRPQ